MKTETKAAFKAAMKDNFRAVSWTLLPLGAGFVLFLISLVV